MSNVIPFPLRPNDPDVAMFRRAIALYDQGQFDQAWLYAAEALNGRFPEIVDSGFREDWKLWRDDVVAG